MIEITVCVGSACHTKGSYEVVKRFQEVIKERELTTKIQLKGSFCLGKCAQATTIRIGEDYYTSIESKDVDQLIDQVLDGSFWRDNK